MAGGKRGALGLAALAGVFGLRFADDCAKTGAKVGDDVVRLGDDAARLGARTVDAVPSPAVAAAVKSDDAMVDALTEAGLEVALQVASYEMPEGVDTPRWPSQVRCPAPRDLTLEPERWSAFLNGLGIACVPAVFVGRARGEALEVDGRFTAVPDLLEACAVAGGQCFFVGCEGEGRCYSDAMRAAVGIRAPHDDVSAYARALAQRQLTEAKPAWVAYASGPGVFTIVRRAVTADASQ